METIRDRHRHEQAQFVLAAVPKRHGARRTLRVESRSFTTQGLPAIYMDRRSLVSRYIMQRRDLVRQGLALVLSMRRIESAIHVDVVGFEQKIQLCDLEKLLGTKFCKQNLKVWFTKVLEMSIKW